MASRVFVVTGGTGFIGGQVIKELAGRGIPVRALVRSEDKAAKVRELGATEVAIGDLRDPASLEAALEGAYGVYHIGALYREAGLPDQVYFDINATGTRNIFEVAVKKGISRLIHCSTGGVLGHIANPPAKETDPYNPGDVYQRSKVEGEKIALDFYRSGRMRGVVIRPGMVYGPGDTRHLKMFKMIARKLWFYVGRGDAWVNFIDVRDLARAFVLAMEHEELNGEVYHIAGTQPVKLHEAVSMIAKEFGVPEPKVHLPVKPMQLLGTACEKALRSAQGWWSCHDPEVSR